MIELQRLGPARTRADVHLICLPYAGGGPHVFAGWHRSLPPWVEVRSPVLPGRGALVGARPFENLDHYVAALDASIEVAVGARPWVIFGHSLGALVAYELTVARLAAGRSGPAVLFVAGREPPTVAPRRKRIAALPDAGFLQELARMEGTPPEVLGNDELMELLLPALRADFGLHENHRPTQRERLKVPIVVFAGHRDREAKPSDVARWAECTQASFRVIVVEGGHFFLRDRAHEVIAEIAGTIEIVVSPSGRY